MLAETDAPGVTGASMYVTPPSTEYWSLETATSSVADSSSVCGFVIRQLLFPSGGEENAAVPMTGAVVSATAAAAPTDSALTAPTALIANTRRPKRLTATPLVSRPGGICLASCGIYRLVVKI